MQRPAHQASESVALNPPLLQTKLQLPAIPPRVLFCDRIKRLSLEECRLALLVAPAGFGKTTATLLSLQRHRKRTRWYRLEREDSFLPVFYGHLLSMLFPGQNRFQSVSFRMFSSLGNLQEDYPLLNAQICQDMAGLCGESAHDLFLVFDDYQAVMENDTIRLTMQYFASNMPECVHMIIASRKDPDILTGKLSLHPRCHLFDATNLLFQRHEIRSLVQEVVSLLCLIGETDPTESLLAEAQGAAAFFARENPGHGMMEFSQAVVGAIHKKRGEYAQAERIFAECLALCSKKRARQSAYGIYLHLCDLYFLMGDEESGRRYLDLWANLGKERGYVYSTTMDFSTLHRVLKRAESEHLHGTYCRLLNSYHEKNRAVREDDTVSVRLFGPFQLIYRNMTLAESDFKTKKVCGILKYVLARRTVQSRERLAALFWPDADRKSSQTSLRVALYELRKTLAKVGLPFESDTALLEETKEGMRLKEGAAVEIDVHEFDRLFRQWEESATDDVQALIELCSLYRGPFLGESECDDWATIRREHYASMYAEAVHTLGHKALEGTSAPAIQEQLVRSLEMNPLDEECAATLIALYCKEGQQARAKSFYRRFKQRFRAEMGVEARLSL